MNSKKAITLLVLTTLLLSMIPLIPVSAALGTNDIPNLTSSRGSYGDDREVNGTGVTPGSTVELYWDLVQPWDGEAGKIEAAKAKPTGKFSIEFEVPEAIVGEHYLWVKDTATGAVEMVGTANPSDEFIVDPIIKLSTSNGLGGDTITVNGYGYNASVQIENIAFYNTTSLHNVTTGLPKTNDVGSWSDTFKIPTTQSGWDWVKGDYFMNATDFNGHVCDGVPFTIGASISLSVEEGPSGTVVKITGRGFDPLAALDETNVLLNGVECYVIDSPVDVDGNGAFSLQAVIPSSDGVTDLEAGEEYDLVVDDGLGNNPDASFTVTGLPSISLSPQYQVQGGQITVTGENYTKLSGKKVSVYLGATKIGEATTTSAGTFSKSFTVPAVASDTYEVYAQMADYNLNATKNFRVGMMIVILSPDSGATGAQVTLTGTGFTKLADGGKWNVTIGGKSVNEIGVEEDTNADGTISMVITIPTLPAGVHTVEVLDIEAEIVVTAEFEVTNTAMITIDPATVPNGFMVEITGNYFTQIDDTELTFQLYNTSGLWDITVGNETAVEISTNVDGDFYGNWTIFTLDDLSLGTYWINVTDGKGIYAEAQLDIVDKTVSIDPRKSTFRIGETIAFNIETSFAVPNSYIKIWDPSGNLYWQTDVFGQNVWVSLALTKIVPFYSQTAGGNPMMLLDDAPLGQYSWKWYDDGDDDIAKNSDDEVVDSGVFTVAAAEADVIGQQVTDLANQITDLQDSLSSVTDEFDSVKSDIADVAAVAQQAVTAAQQAAQAVQTVAQTANQANTAAQNAADAANAAKDAANSLTTLVYGAIGAALVAALAAIVSLMQISRRIAG